MNLFKPLSIKTKLILTFLAISVFTVVFCAGLFVYNDLKMLRKIMARNLTVLAGSIGVNSIGSLVFHDSGSAQNILSSLKKEYQVQFGVLYDAEGNILATYKKTENVEVHAPRLKGEGHLFLQEKGCEGDIEIVKNIIFRDETVGKIFLHAKMSELEKQLKKYILFAGFLILLALIISTIISLYFQRIISNPILSLAEKAKTVTEKGDYSIRVHYKNKDELGTLYSWFNKMMEKIEDAEIALKEYSRKLVDSQEKERTRIAAELHDSLGQNLITIKNGIKRYLSSVKTKNEAENGLEQVADLAVQSLEEVRHISNDLHPHMLDQLGLKTALEAMIEKTSQSAGLEILSDIEETEKDLSKEMKLNIYRIVQEGLTNILKHSKAAKAGVSLEQKENTIALKISDNGKGFDTVKIKSSGFGLISIQERVEMLGGGLTIDSTPGKGTILAITINS